MVKLGYDSFGANILADDSDGKTDTLQITATAANNTILVQPGASNGKVVVATEGGSFNGTGVEAVVIDAGTGADTIIIKDLNVAGGVNSGVQNVSLDLGRQATQTGTALVTIDDNDTPNDTSDDRKENQPVFAYSTDNALDTVLIDGAGGNDTFNLSLENESAATNGQMRTVRIVAAA